MKWKDLTLKDLNNFKSWLIENKGVEINPKNLTIYLREWRGQIK